MINGMVCKFFHKKEVKLFDMFTLIIGLFVNLFVFIILGLVLGEQVYDLFQIYLSIGFGVLGSLIFTATYVMIWGIVLVVYSYVIVFSLVFIINPCIAKLFKIMNFTVVKCPKYAKK